MNGGKVKHGEFGYLDGRMVCDGVSVSAILHLLAATPDGGTPLYVYSEKGLFENCDRIKRAFPWATVRYATKACMNLSILRHIHDEHKFGFDVVSSGELNRVLRAGARGSEIVYAGAAKTDEEIREAVKAGVTIVVEKPEELAVIEQSASGLEQRVRMLLRLRPNVDAHTHKHLTTGTAFSKFGMPESAVRSILNDWKGKWATIEGIHFHIGSQIGSPEYTAQAIEVALPIIDQYGLSVLDTGGGFPVSYEEGVTVPSVDSFAEAIHAAIGGREIEVMIEPGRSATADIGILVASVMSEEHGEDEEGNPWRMLTCNAGMADLIRPMLYEAIHQVWSVVEGDPLNIPTSVAGPYCESTDFLARSVLNLPAMNRGDLIAVFDAGAYGRAMASNYNGNLFAAEVMVMADGTIRVIGHRQTFAHSIELETDAMNS